MFEALKEKYENSSKEKADLLEYAKNLHAGLIHITDLNTLFDHSLVSEAVIDSIGLYIKLNTGIKLYINPKDYEEVPITCLCTREYEPEETEMVMNILRRYENDSNFTVLDVGANIGWYTLNIMNAYPQMRVFSFEPSPTTFNRLQNNLTLNKFSVQGAVNCGLYKEKGTIDFYYDEEGSGASSLVNLRDKEKIQKISVSVDTMDSWVSQNEIDRVDFIKCDVEGSEFFVYQGGRETIQKYKPIIFSEMLRKWSAKFGYHPNDIIRFMSEIGYQCFVIHSDRLVALKEVTEDTIETNYFFLHADRHKNLISDLS